VSGLDRNTLWASAFADELARAGVREMCVAPGSRSTPLVLAFAVHGGFRLRVHLDERSLGFFALGIGKASGVPAVVLTTSGTAAANLFPAVIEASHGETPLLVLTADRPHRMRDGDANQAIDQLRLFGPFVREFFDVAPAAVEGPALRHLRSLAGRAVASAVGAPAGPVHLNFPFDRPLEPIGSVELPTRFEQAHPRAALGRPESAPYVDVTPRRPPVGAA
jgi:2-succinyl-5-enolpyruvyl-6-hydroxy-3-cyclohexene-1-carboxylate synthase